MEKKRYHRAGTVKIEEVLKLIKEFSEKEHRYKVVLNGYRVNVNSNRLKTFLNGTVCNCCQSKASYFAIEKTYKKHLDNEISKQGYHLNLYGYNKKGEEILFTHDHTLARGLGGTDTLDNTTTMCSPCNSHKGQLESRIKTTNSLLYKKLLQNEIECFLKTGIKFTPENPEPELDINYNSKNYAKKMAQKQINKIYQKINKSFPLTDEEKELLQKHEEKKGTQYEQKRKPR